MPPTWAIAEAAAAREQAERAERALLETAKNQNDQRTRHDVRNPFMLQSKSKECGTKRVRSEAEDPQAWPSGAQELERAVRRGRWADGSRVGKGHVRPYLQRQYARAIADGVKTVEGRPCTGWAAIVRTGDYVHFTISGSAGAYGKDRLAVRVLGVKAFSSFQEMLEACSIGACLPGFTGSLADAVRLYRSFGSSAGSYADLERSVGVTAVTVAPLASVVDEQEPCDTQ